MFIKIFEGSTPNELELKVNEYLKSDVANEYDLHSINQSESMIEHNGNLERHITLTCIFIESLFGDDLSEDDL
ncbi:MAG: hypothetical protein OEV44_10525 [Spirochaetota bacterium]|nr:hypothetical protein [Spirochaetota bacterium]